jgi:hypothetical protein
MGLYLDPRLASYKIFGIAGAALIFGAGIFIYFIASTTNTDAGVRIFEKGRLLALCLALGLFVSIYIYLA